jgi:hypothetical protein
MVQVTGETNNPFIGLKVADIKPKKIHILKNFGNLCLLVLQLAWLLSHDHCTNYLLNKRIKHFKDMLPLNLEVTSHCQSLAT